MQPRDDRYTPEFSWRLSNALGIGLVAGGLFTWGEFLWGFSSLHLPVSHDLEYLAYLTYVNSAAAVALIIGARLPLFRRINRYASPGWLVLSMFLCLFAFATGFKELWLPMRVLASASLAVFLVVLGLQTIRKLPSFPGPSSWAIVNYLGLLTCLVLISLKGPVEHAVYVGSIILFIPAAILSVALLVVLTRRSTIRAAASALPIVALLAFWFVRPLLAGHGANNYNVILISIDTLRSDHLGIYGNLDVKTPYIDELENRGVVFENALSPIPKTNPSHTTMLTGLYPAHHSVIFNQPISMAQNAKTLPSMLHNAGYKTAGFVSGWTLANEASRLNEHFEVYDDCLGPSSSTRNLCARHTIPKYLTGVLKMLGVYRSDWRDRRAAETVSATAQWLRANAADPFFLFVHLFDPHDPYEPPAPFDKMYDPHYAGDKNGYWYSMSYEEQEWIIERPDELNHIKALYAGEVSYADGQIGRLFTAIGQLGLWDNTLVVLTSDHGESLTEHNYYFNHSRALYQPSLRVPLIFCFPDSTIRRQRVSEIVELTDLFPTILEYLGMDVPPSDGRSVMALVRGEETEDGERIAIASIFEGEIEGSKWLLALQSQKYKYILTSPYWIGLIFRPDRTDELYALDIDPGELNNVVGDLPEVADEFRSMADPYVELWYSHDTSKPVKLSDDAIRKLRSLGYIK